MKVAIIGAGSVGALALLKTLEHLKREESVNTSEVLLFSDPDTPITKVGEAGTWVIVESLIEVLGKSTAEEVLNMCNYTTRKGTKFIWPENPLRDFCIEYQKEGLHFDSNLFSKLTISKAMESYPIIKWVETRVLSSSNNSINSIYNNFDLIIDCGGTPNAELLKSTEYCTPEFSSVNAAWVSQQDKVHTQKEWTEAIFVKHGWMFTVPLQNRTDCGYIFNSNITTKAEALKDFKRKAPIEILNPRFITWDFYFKAKAFDKGVLTLGNKLFFFEPAQAIPLHFYHDLLHNFFINYSKSLEDSVINYGYINRIHMVLALLAFNYSGDMEIKNSTFWDSVRHKALEFINRNPQYISKTELGFNIWNHGEVITNKYIEGFKIKIEEKR